MASRTIKAGSTSKIITVELRSATTGQLVTGIAAASVTYQYSREGDSARSYGTCSTGTLDTWSSGGWIEIDSTNQKGKYQFGVPNAAIASGAIKADIVLIVSGCIDQKEIFELEAVDRQDAVRLGMTALPNADAGATGGIITQGTGTAQLSVTGGAVNTVTDITNNLAKYMHGAVWIDTVNGATGTASYTNGIVSNPCSTIASAKTIADNLKIKRFWIQSGSSVALGTDYTGYVFTGAGYTIDLSTRDVSKSIFERSENLSGSGATCPTGEAAFYECHLGNLSIGEADFHRCHLNGTITMSQASVPYLFNNCIGVTSAKITFAAASQSAVVKGMGGVLTVAGLAAGRTLYIDGNCNLTLDNTNTGGTVYINGAVTLTNNSTGVTVIETSRYSEPKLTAAIWNYLTSAMTTVGSIGKKLADWVVGKVISYDTNMSPASQILVNTNYKLLTDSSGKVTIAEASIDSNTFAANAITDETLSLGAIQAIQAGLATSLEISTLPTDAEFVAALNASVVDGTISFANLSKLILAILAGEATVGTGTVAYKRTDGSTTAITVTHDTSGNRTSVTFGTLS